MVIRDLTLRSAASFGSFHLIRLLYDEYMFYLVEHRVAEATGETPIAMMGEVRAQEAWWATGRPPGRRAVRRAGHVPAQGGSTGGGRAVGRGLVPEPPDLGPDPGSPASPLRPWERLLLQMEVSSTHPVGVLLC